MTVHVFFRATGKEKVYTSVSSAFCESGGILSIIQGNTRTGIPIDLILEYKEVQTP